MNGHTTCYNCELADKCKGREYRERGYYFLCLDKDKYYPKEPEPEAVFDKICRIADEYHLYTKRSLLDETISTVNACRWYTLNAYQITEVDAESINILVSMLPMCEEALKKYERVIKRKRKRGHKS